ncbi:MAG: bifunctional phosphopantothenoylcysteine decarboxylase/phosphopantothenate--cysteine ligase CoaBC [Coriobacteriales bacterium]|jgi:phosphopantothenoylcysteine decarboxylase/phosphopantothenate--cysteine ligase
MDERQQEKQPTVLVCVTGCIAAYKACEIVRGLQKAGCDVKVTMTEHATEFVGPTTFRALTGHEVSIGLFDHPSDPVHHISLAKEADAVVVAPATANVIAKIACGIADDLMTTTILATKAPIVVAPAMNVGMWTNPQTQANVAALAARGMRIVAPGSGYLACGDVGQGRLAEPADIVSAVLDELRVSHELAGKRVLVTAGPTREAIDDVRYLSNASSGKQGYAIAEEAARRGAQVTLVSGPTGLSCPAGVERIDVMSAEEMLDACLVPFSEADFAFFVAAVSDWRPATPAKGKLKRAGDLDLKLVRNPDIAATLGARKGSTKVIAFCAETQDPVESAKKKLVDKNADLVVANDVSAAGVEMGSSDNHVWFVTAESVEELPTQSKTAVARALLDRVSR